MAYSVWHIDASERGQVCPDVMSARASNIQMSVSGLIHVVVEIQLTTPTPLELQIADQFREGLAEVEGVPAELVERLHGLLVGDETPTAATMLEMITSTTGDQIV